MRISGIYCITNKITGDRYIGSSVNINRRFKKHRTELRHNKHSNPILQRAFNKYGEDAFYFGIVEICENIIEREQQYLDTKEFKYNICEIAGSPGSRPCSEETRAKLRITSSKRKGFKLSLEARRNQSIGKMSNRNKPRKAVESIDPDTGLIKEYAAVSYVKADGYDPSAVVAAIKKHKKHKGMLWNYHT